MKIQNFTMANVRSSLTNKSLLVFLFSLIPFVGVVSQPFTGTYNFASVTTSSGTTDPTPVPTATGVTFGSFSAVGSFSANSNAAGRFSFTNNPLGATNSSDVFTGSFPTGQYYQVTVTVTGTSVDLSGITFTIQRSGTGIRQFAVRSDADGYAANLPASESVAALSVVATNVFQITDPTTAATPGSTITLSGPGFTGLTTGATRTFRFYGWNAEAVTGTFSIDDVVISGTSAVSSPTVNVTGTSNKFYANEGNFSEPQSFGVTGSALTANLTVGPTTGYQFATSVGGTYSSSLSLTPSAGSVSATVFVRLNNSLTPGTYGGTINFASTGATTVTRTPSGEVYASPSTGFAAGNIVTLRVGEAAGPALSGNSAPIFLDEYTPTGTFVKSFPLPFSVNGSNRRFTMSGSSTSEGYLNLSPDGQYLTFAGYDNVPGVPSIIGTPSATTNRIVARVTQNGTINTTTRINDGYDGNNIRSAATVDGNAFWTGGAGTGGGTRYMPLGNTSTSTLISSTPGNTRGTAIYNSQLYISAQSGTNRGINTVGTGLPTTSGNTTSIISGQIDNFAPNAHGFVFVDTDDNGTPDVMYVADANNGLMKFSNTAGTWTARGALPNPAGRNVYGVTASVITPGTNRRIYLNLGTSSTIASEIYTFVDNSAVTANITSNGTDIIAACGSPIITSPNALNVGFKGVSFAPVDVPTPTINHTFTSAGTTINQGVADAPLYRIQCDITDGNALLTGVTVTTAGTYAASDIDNFRLFVSTDPTLDGGDVLLSTINTSSGPGQTLAFTGLGQNLPVGTTRYLFVAASVSSCSAIGGTISITSTPLANITYSNPAAVKNGTPLAGTPKTIQLGTLANVTGLTASSGSPNVNINWTNPSCFDQILVVAHTSSITANPSGTVYTSNLNYASAPAFPGGGRVLYYGTVSPQSTTGYVSGTTYFIKVFVRKGTIWSSGVQVTAIPQNPVLYSRGSGLITDPIWALTPTGTAATAASLGGFSTTTSIQIQSGHTVSWLGNSNQPFFNVTVDAGGAITGGSITNTYLNVHGNAIVNNGTIGTIANDGIAFNIEGVSTTWSGNGVNNVARIRKNTTTNATSALIISANVNVHFEGAAVYNNTDNTFFNVTISPLRTLSLNSTGPNGGDFSFDGTNGASGGERGGVLTVNGTLNLTGRFFAMNNNNSSVAPVYATNLIINAGGRVFTRDIDVNTVSGDGSAVTIAAAGRLAVSGKMRMLGGSLAATNNIQFNSGAVLLHGAGTVDGALPCPGTITGQVSFRRQGSASPYPFLEYNYWSSPVINSPASVILTSQTGINGYRFNPTLATAPNQAGFIPAWVPISNSTLMEQGVGYISTNAGLANFVGTPYEGSLSVPLTGNVFTRFNLVGNPYPSSISASQLFAANSGQFGSLHFWDDDNSAGSGYSPADYVVVNTLGGASGGNGASWTGQIASCQGFFVESATTSNTISFNNSMRTANAATFFETPTDLQRFWITLLGESNVGSEILLAFLPSATEGFDLSYDAQRFYVNPNLSLSSTLNGGNYAIQAWPEINHSLIIPLSVNATNANTHQIKITGIDNIDPTVIIYLEDTETGALHNLRGGPFTFNGENSISNSNRFRIRFSKATTFTTQAQDCQGLNGSISIESDENVWNYTLSKSDGLFVSSGVLSSNAQFNNLSGGDYILSLTRPEYETNLVIPVEGVEMINAMITSTDNGLINESIQFSVSTSPTSNVVWYFGDNSSPQSGSAVSHIYTQPGLYQVEVIVSNEDCESQIVQLVQITDPVVTGIEETAKQFFRVMPNPAQDQLTVVQLGKGNAELTIFDISGKVVLRETISSTAQVVSIANLAGGIYSVVLQQEDRYGVQKLVVQK